MCNCLYLTGAETQQSVKKGESYTPPAPPLPARRPKTGSSKSPVAPPPPTRNTPFTASNTSGYVPKKPPPPPPPDEVSPSCENIYASLNHVKQDVDLLKHSDNPSQTVHSKNSEVKPPGQHVVSSNNMNYLPTSHKHQSRHEDHVNSGLSSRHEGHVSSGSLPSQQDSVMSVLSPSQSSSSGFSYRDRSESLTFMNPNEAQTGLYSRSVPNFAYHRSVSISTGALSGQNTGTCDSGIGSEGNGSQERLLGYLANSRGSLQSDSIETLDVVQGTSRYHGRDVRERTQSIQEEGQSSQISSPKSLP